MLVILFFTFSLCSWTVLHGNLYSPPTPILLFTQWMLAYRLCLQTDLTLWKSKNEQQNQWFSGLKDACHNQFHPSEKLFTLFIFHHFLFIGTTAHLISRTRNLNHQRSCCTNAEGSLMCKLISHCLTPQSSPAYEPDHGRFTNVKSIHTISLVYSCSKRGLIYIKTT